MSEIEIWNELGNIYYNSGAYNKAIRTCRKMIELDPECGLPYINLGFIFVCQGLYAQAIPMFQEAIRLLGETINKAFLWKQMGDAYRKLEDYRNAIASYQVAIELDPQDASIQHTLAELELISRASDPAAMPKTNGNTVSSPGSEGTDLSSPGIEDTGRSRKGNVCWVFEDNNPPAKVDKESMDVSDTSPVILGSRVLSDVHFEEAVTNNPVSMEESTAPGQNPVEVPHPASSSGIQELHAYDLANENRPIDLQESVESIEKAAHAMLRLGILHRRKGENERAFQFMQTAIETAEKSQNHFFEALCHYAIAQVETSLGRIEDAIQSYQSAANLAPERVYPWNNLGNLNCSLDRYEDAQAAFQEAIEHDPRDPVAWNGLGDVYHKLGRYEDSIAAYQLGNVFEKHAEEEDILTEFEKAMDSDQENPQVWDEAGNIYYATGAYKDAVSSYCKAIELDPADATSKIGLAKAEQAMNKADIRGDAPTNQTPAEINQDFLPQPESLLPGAAVPQAEVSSTPKEEPTRSESTREVEPIHEQLNYQPDSPADSESDPAYWMFKSLTSHANPQQDAANSRPEISETALRIVEPIPAYTGRSLHEQAFPGNPLLQGSNHDRASILVQLPPRASRPSRMEENNNIPVLNSLRESASIVEDTKWLKAASAATGIETTGSAPLTPKKEDLTKSQASLDLQIHKNDIAAYRRVTELNPKNDRAWDTLGNMYESAGLHKEAITAFEQAIALDPQKEAYHYHLGIALAYQEQYDKAIQALHSVLALNPQYMLAHCALAGYYRKLGRETEAQEHIRIARPSIENENEYNQACFESISGDADRAIALLEIALEKQQVQPAMVRSDPDLDFIRKDPRFKALLYKNGIISQ